MHFSEVSTDDLKLHDRYKFFPGQTEEIGVGRAIHLMENARVTGFLLVRLTDRSWIICHEWHVPDIDNLDIVAVLSKQWGLVSEEDAKGAMIAFKNRKLATAPCQIQTINSTKNK